MSATDPLAPLVAALVATRQAAGASLPPHRLGTVTSVASGVAVMFDGEGAASGRTYPYLSPYTPTVGDRVLLGQVGTTWVVLGAVLV